MRHAAILLMGLLGAALVLPPSLPPSLPQTCITRENTLLGQMETTCPDGTRAISRYNALLDRWETTITPGPPRVIPGPQAPGKRERS